MNFCGRAEGFAEDFEGGAEQVDAAAAGEEFVGGGLAVAHSPGGGRLAEQDRALRPGENAAAEKVAQQVAAALAADVGPQVAAFEDREGFLDRVAGVDAKVAAEEAVAPSGLVGVAAAGAARSWAGP